ncbi:MAG: sulfatase-like hydrolase/transferase [Phycisphaeraceae bacterium]
MGERPNLLFVTAEDMCPHLGCFGDHDAITPHLDRFATQGVRFNNVFSVHPCCSPSRACMATGVYPTRLGTFQHRGTMWVSPQQVRTVPSLLREAGYYTFNGTRGGTYKTDYNFEPHDDPWDRVRSEDIEWRNRAPGQPFFGQVNLFRTHQSKYGRRPPGEPHPARTHDPAAVRLPPYHPDTPAVREIWAEYHDRITEMDSAFGQLMKLLNDDGLADDTIVLFLGDNGCGIPGGKIWLWEQGLHVPMIVRVPETWRSLLPAAAGAASDRLVSFLDIAPTMLALCGIQPPPCMPGRRFLGPAMDPEPDLCFAARDYHDGADFDFSRAVRNGHFHYVRNFMPHLRWDPILYSWSRAPHLLTEWLEQAERGALDPHNRQSAFFRPYKPVEELYDIVNDPHCMHNLAFDASHATTLTQMHRQCEQWMLESGDLGLLSQYELYERSQRAGTPYALAQDRSLNPTPRLLEAATLAGRRDASLAPQLEAMLRDDDATLRRWGAIGLLALKQPSDALRAGLADPSPDVRLVAAEALGDVETFRALLGFPDGIIRQDAIFALVRLGERARPLLPDLDKALAPCPRRDIWSSDNVAQGVTLLRSCLHAPVADDGSLIPYALTRRTVPDAPRAVL